MDVHFEHWQHTFSRKLLEKYSSRYHSGRDRGLAGLKAVLEHATRFSQFSTVINKSQILCANEAFPEAAIADPIADLEVWDAWQTGVRQFPFRGHYRRLGISRQKKKRSSNTTVGVLGEILAGLLGQCGIGPLIVVRVIGNWPDFIFALGERRFAFLESKAYTGALDGTTGLLGRVQKRLLIEATADAIPELAVDDLLSIWYSFTHIESVRPLKVKVTFLEMKSTLAGTSGRRKSDLPDAVVDGLATRALEQAMGRLCATTGDDFESRVNTREKQALAELQTAASKMMPELLDEAGIPGEDQGELQAAMTRLVRKLGAKSRETAHEISELVGRRLSEAKATAVQGALSSLRSIDNGDIFIADFPKDVRRDWSPDFRKVNQSYGCVHGIPLWRCGGVLFGIGAQSHRGELLTTLDSPPPPPPRRKSLP